MEYFDFSIALEYMRAGKTVALKYPDVVRFYHISENGVLKCKTSFKTPIEYVVKNLTSEAILSKYWYEAIDN